ncbi:MAG: PQQ-dependent sugar dehydrogenase, partial [Planctomycetia bacterium]|nr:PQQ-dependent sugar dehydrogenase [Planctomycetia bacterium]
MASGWIILGILSAAVGQVGGPMSSDPRLVIEPFAAEPRIVTPTGIAVDRKGRVLVIESHTHFRPEGYQGPPADRIRWLEDTDGDGRADRASTFFEGSKFTMGLAFHPDGRLYVATRNEVFRLRDGDSDGRADGPPESLVRLETAGNYPHNGLSGFAFDASGLVYFGLGENLGADYRLIGKDGKTLSGGGEGGNVYRCRPDGGGLERVATGFWNPFGQAFDTFGRLFVVDNDPDSRPPCRLVHVVPGGDYGYRFRNGRKGLHPFTAWNGELPGTLPMVAGTGEAPSGVVAYESDNLPDDYRGNLLTTSWGDHRVERFRLRPQGASFKATAEPVVTGGEDFRPVGIAVAPDGSIYLSDWVDKSYNVHGKGRVWHLRAKNPPARVAPKHDLDDLAHPDRPTREAAARALRPPPVVAEVPLFREVWRAASRISDPRARAAAIDAVLGRNFISIYPNYDPMMEWNLLFRLDPSDDVRALAVRRFSDRGNHLSPGAARDPSPLV